MPFIRERPETTADAISGWIGDPDPTSFPFEQVLSVYHSGGKHFVPDELLRRLADVRALLPGLTRPWPHVETLAFFLDTALDKADGRYDYRSYLALPLLRLPSVQDPVEQDLFARSRCDRLTVQLVTDALAFELAALDGGTDWLPRMRPDPDLVVKRCKHGLRAIRPALERMALDAGLAAATPVQQARQVCEAVRADMALDERRVLRLTMLPVDTIHDEHLFLRVLQTFETTFALLAVQLRGAMEALSARAVERALHFLAGSEAALRESGPLFSMLATMQVESFRAFRQFTEGASAIQSRNYKIVESLCREPDTERVDSPAYQSVPEVRDQVLAGQRTLDDAYREATGSGDLGENEVARLADGMRSFARALLRWRNTHYRLAVRMLGEKPGTGYTAGTPYLNAVRDIEVFRSVDTVEEIVECR
ncbi:tryptophan 2,3-dioxygenase family protein [Nonomuraea gerenzanensis]|uniref:tryptophan 2,3-dioxygenase family protein n=1 Tax=Nonomuraea gerenzanensis TaxID=93944 RepID=UPI001CD96435|nr:tryptophan 2,3-dioxygenase family protein [Nonomuraea gerenzanensis]UBU17871.1 hypothetical protein LCN96_23460 [Nonomuraea gerenzanensis]